MKRTNCTSTESFKPSASRSFSRSSKLVSSPTIWLIGSPTKRNNANAIKATTSMTSTASSARRITKASMGYYPPGEGGRHSIFPEPVEQDLIVGPLNNVDLLGDAPDQRLLVQRDVSRILVNHSIGLRDHVVALGLVAFHENLVAQLLDLGIAVIAEIELPTLALLVAAAGEVQEHVPGI